MIFVKPNLLVHSGGTKFYEVIIYVNESSGKAVVVKRWGRIESRSVGGQQKFENHLNADSANKSAGKVIAEKLRGGYEIQAPDASDSLFQRRGPMEIKDADFSALAVENYGDRSTASGLVSYLRIAEGEASASDSATQPTRKRNEPEPVRSEDWGSW